MLGETAFGLGVFHRAASRGWLVLELVSLVLLMILMLNGNELLLLLVVMCEGNRNLSLHRRLKGRTFVFPRQRPRTSSRARSCDRFTRRLTRSRRLPFTAACRSHRRSLLAARQPKSRHPLLQSRCVLILSLGPGSSALSTTFILLIAHLSSYRFLCA